MSESKAQCVLGRHLLSKGHDFVVPNKCLVYEADLISINKSGYLNEYEIKCSKADYLNESKNKSMKHSFYGTGRSASQKPNYFWIVIFGEFFHFENINEKYGIIHLDEKGEGKIVKRARLLHKQKATDDKNFITSLARALSFKIFNRYQEVLND